MRKLLVLMSIGWFFLTFQEGKLQVIGPFGSERVCEESRGAYSGWRDKSPFGSVWSHNCFQG